MESKKDIQKSGECCGNPEYKIKHVVKHYRDVITGGCRKGVVTLSAEVTQIYYEV